MTDDPSKITLFSWISVDGRRARLTLKKAWVPFWLVVAGLLLFWGFK